MDEAAALRAIDTGLRLVGSEDVVAVESAIGAVQPALAAVREPGARRKGHFVLGMLYGSGYREAGPPTWSGRSAS